MNLFLNRAILRRRYHRFAEKKMKRELSSIGMLIMSLHLYAQDGYRGIMAGTDIADAIAEKRITITIGHAFSERWSIQGQTGFNFSHLIRKGSIKEKEHETAFAEEECQAQEKSIWESGEISVCHWPQGPYCGYYFSTGLRIKGNGIPDFVLGAGYAVRIWKGLSAAISLNLSLTDRHMESRTRNMMSVLLYYNFK